MRETLVISYAGMRWLYYINVLKLYQLDRTADQQIKELQAEVITTEVCIISYIQIFLSAGEVSNSK